MRRPQARVLRRRLPGRGLLVALALGLVAILIVPGTSLTSTTAAAAYASDTQVTVSVAASATSVASGTKVTYTYTIKNSTTAQMLWMSGTTSFADSVCSSNGGTLPKPSDATATGWSSSMDAGTTYWAISSGKTATLTCTITATNTTSSDITLTNSATVKNWRFGVTTEYHSTSGVGTASVVVKAASAPDLTVTKTASAAAVRKGDTVTYTLTVKNSGSGADTAYTVTDTVPSQFTNVATTTAGCTVSGNTVSCPTTTSLAAGATRTITITAVAATTGSTTNTATVKDNSGAETATTNNSATAAVTITADSLAVTNSASQTSVEAGTDVTYTVVVTNTGSSTSGTYTLTDTFPGITTSSLSVDDSTCTISRSTVTCSGAALAAGATRTIHVTGTAAIASVVTSVATASNATTSASSSVTVTYTKPTSTSSGSSGGSVTSSDGVVTLTKTASTYTISSATSVTYTYTVRNNSTTRWIGSATTGSATTPSDVLADDKCPAITYGSGWTTRSNSTHYIAPGATATLTCTQTISATTTNTATLSGLTTAYEDPAFGWTTETATVASVSATATVNLVSTSSAVPLTCSVPAVFDANNHGSGTTTYLDSQTQGSPIFSAVTTSGTYSGQAARLRKSGTSYAAVSGAAYSYNALGWNPTDGLLYAVTNADNDIRSGYVVTIDAKGTIRNTGVLIQGVSDTDLQAGSAPGVTGGLNTGFFDDAGNYYVSNGSSSGLDDGSIQLLKVNLTTGATTQIASDTGLEVNDFTYADGYAWGIVWGGTHKGQMARVALDGSGTVSYFSLAGLGLPSGTYGAAWTYDNGNLGFDNNSGGWYQIQVTGPSASTPTFTLVSSGVGPASYNNDGASCSVPETPDLSITKAMVSPDGAVVSGATVQWSIVVTNNGPGVSSGFTVADSLPSGFTAKSAIVTDAKQTSSGSCKISGSTYTCTSTGSMAVGDRRTITITAVAPATYTSATRCFTNTASVTGNETDPVSSNDTATTPRQCLDSSINVAKVAGSTVASGPVNGVYTATWTITVTNTGTTSTTYTQLTDTPEVRNATVTSVAWSGGPTSATSTTASPVSSGSSTYAIGSSAAKTLAVGATDTYKVTTTYTLASGKSTSDVGTCAKGPDGYYAGGFVNAAVVPEQTGTTTDDFACENPPTTTPALNVAKTATNAPDGTPYGTLTGPVNGVYTATYAVTVQNVGSVDATYTRFTDTPSVAGMTVTGVTWSGGPSSAASTAAASAGSSSYYIGTSTSKTLAVGATDTYTVTVSLTLNSGSTFRSTVGSCVATSRTAYSGGVANGVTLPQETATTTDNDACVNPPVEITLVKMGRYCDTNLSTCTLTGAAFDLYSTDPTTSGATPIANGVTASGDGSVFTTAPLDYGHTYWLVEKKAPSGHQLLADSISFTVDPSSGIVIDPASYGTASLDASDSTNLTLDVQDPTRTYLPAAGGTGFTPFAALGLLLLECGAAVYAATRSSRPRPAPSRA